jgi:hypothetical protein
MSEVLDGLLMTVVLLAWGTQAVVPWRLAGRHAGKTGNETVNEADNAPDPSRRLWAYAVLPLYAAGFVAVLSWAQTHPDATVAAGLVPLTASPWGRALAILAVALLAAALVTVVGWRRLEDAGWRILGGFGLAALAATCLVAELVRAGEGPASPLPVAAAAAACRLLVALAAGETLAPWRAGRPLLALAAAPAFAAWFFVIPVALSDALVRSGAPLTAAAAAVLFLGARWLPASLRRPALAAAALLAGLFFAQAAAVSQGLSAPVFSPLPPLPGPG